MDTWYQVFRFFGAKAAEFRSYDQALEYRRQNCPSGRIIPRVEHRPGRPVY